MLLASLPFAEGSMSVGPQDIAGDTYLDSVYFQDCLVTCTHSRSVGYNLSRDYSLFRATVGLGDNSESAAEYLMEIYVDGTRAWGAVVTLGFSEVVEINVTNALRLELRVDAEEIVGAPSFGTPTLEP